MIEFYKVKHFKRFIIKDLQGHKGYFDLYADEKVKVFHYEEKPNEYIFEHGWWMMKITKEELDDNFIKLTNLPKPLSDEDVKKYSNMINCKCPFCKSEEIVVDDTISDYEYQYFYAYCSNCNASTGRKNTAIEAINCWNSLGDDK